jgi:glycosyltransferase involved in cell wall biosynthesis
MKILWITHSPFPEIAKKFNLNHNASGWIHASAQALLNEFADINLAVASFYNGDELNEIHINNVTHFLIPDKVSKDAGNLSNDQFWIRIKTLFNPDVVHIHGTEREHCYSYVRACGADKVVVSIQGIISEIEKHYLGGISKKDLLSSTTLRDLIKMDTIFTQQKKLRKYSTFEKKLLQNVQHVIGRTTWDRHHVWAVNPNAKYHLCNESLRTSFYNNQWSIDGCEKHSIILSQAYYPLKGFHKLLKALPIVLRHFPNTKVYVAGNNYFSNRGIKINGFGRYINSLVKKYNLADHIIFTGVLSEGAMCQRFINSNIFVSPSAIENSPNSVGEAQLLGVPCIASYVGGTPDMVEHGETGFLYRFEEVEMLAAYICLLFSDTKLAVQISEKSKISAAKRHDKNENARTLYNIYLKITGDK